MSSLGLAIISSLIILGCGLKDLDRKNILDLDSLSKSNYNSSVVQLVRNVTKGKGKSLKI